MLSRRFAPLFWCQFFAAFNDNFLKTSLAFAILFHMAAAQAGALVTLASAVFIAPYFVLSGLGGELADRYDKARVAQRIKFVEIFVAALAVVGNLVHSLPLMFVALGGFGVLASLFGPIKYGILPDHLPREKLPAANGLIEGGTFIAILFGTIAGGLAARDGGDFRVFAGL
ncbi:MAG TPA: MFS transporter, partial [Pseudolabrys sp.]|nr:MFS transporter [Pseudolabrys sp.]